MPEPVRPNFNIAPGKAVRPNFTVAPVVPASPASKGSARVLGVRPATALCTALAALGFSWMLTRRR